jgi:predicted RNA-binding protein YlxR (DUF448 family)
MAPVRTCIGCGATRAQAELFRLGLASERVQLDVARRMPGRGGYVCGSPCVEAAIKRKGFGRAFRQKAQVDPQALQASLAKADLAKKARGVR